MASKTSSPYSWFGSGVTLCFLFAWIITSLCTMVLNAGNPDRRFSGSLSSASLLTFLVCKLVIAVTPEPPAARSSAQDVGTQTIAHFIIHASRSSTAGALVLLLCSCMWLYDLLLYTITLFVLSVFGAILGFVIYYGEPLGDGTYPSQSSTDPDQLQQEPEISSTTTAISEFREKTGVDPTIFLDRFPPWIFVIFAATVWVNFLSLGLFVLGHAWRSLWMVLSSPAAVTPDAREKQTAANV